MTEEVPRASTFGKRVAAQARAEAATLLRRGENLLFVLILPVLFLVFFSKVRVGGGSSAPPTVDTLMPPILTMAILSSAFLGLSISTAFERKYLVLKRLGLSPLGRSGLLCAKLLAVAIVEVIQITTLAGVATVFLGWRFQGDAIAALAFLTAGSAAFGAFGMLLAGLLRAEGTLAASNAIYVLLLLFGGVVVPLAKLPKPLGALGRYLPSAALANGLTLAVSRRDFGGFDLAVLTVCFLAFALAAVKTFRWE